MAAYSHSDATQSTVDFVNSQIKELDIPMLHKRVGESIGEDYKKWHYKDPVFIDASTGTGKTTFVYQSLIPYAIHQGWHILLISNRIALSLQQKRAILSLSKQLEPNYYAGINADPDLDQLKDIFYFGSICVCTYQSLYRLINNSECPARTVAWFSRLQYVVFDEIHFLYSDALFNPACGYLLQKLPVVFHNIVRVYMTATSWEIKNDILESERNNSLSASSVSLTAMEQYLYSLPPKQGIKISRTFYYYHREADYAQYHLHFFNDDQACPTLEKKDTITRKKYLRSLVSMMIPAPSSNNKWLIFVDKISSGETLKKMLSDQNISVAYVDAKTKSPARAWTKIAEEECFDQDALIATPVLECGVNINDPAVKNIAILCTDRTSFTQLIGRKRVMDGESVDLWVWDPPAAYFEDHAKKIEHDLRLAYKLEKCRRVNFHGFVDASQEIWKNKEDLQSKILFDIDSEACFAVNPYVYNILQRRYDFLSQFMSADPDLTFRAVVQSWLGIEAEAQISAGQEYSEQLEAVPSDPLRELLGQHTDHEISDVDFKPIRQAIVNEVLRRKVAQIRSDRIATLSPKSLNRFLDDMGYPFHISKNANKWKIEKKV